MAWTISVIPGLLAMIIFCVVLGIIEGYGNNQAKKRYPCRHDPLHLKAGVALPILVAKEGYNTLLGPAITVLAGGIPFILLAVVLFFKTGGQSVSTEWGLDACPIIIFIIHS